MFTSHFSFRHRISIFFKSSSKLVTRIYILPLLCCVTIECFLMLNIAAMINVDKHLIRFLLKQNEQLIFFYSFFICFLKNRPTGQTFELCFYYYLLYKCAVSLRFCYFFLEILKL